MRFCSIASGSSGNCIYVGSDSTHILVDAGISYKKIEAGLNGIGLGVNDLDAVFVTHEHTDHTAGLGVLLRKKQIPVFASAGTIKGLKRTPSLGYIDDDLLFPILADFKVTVKDMSLKPMRISHDANEPLAMRVYSEGKKAGIITDLGTYDEYTLGCLQGMDILLAESNHDVRMLEVGPYPYPLKRRILSDRGHLSNENCGRMVSALLHDNIKHIILGHLSKENNLPEIAYETVRLEITASHNKYTGNDFPISVARRDCPMDVLEI